MRYPTLHYGQRGKEIRSLQSSLARALVKNGITTTNKKNGVYGEQTRQDVARFKRHFNVNPVVGTDFGGDGEWGHLLPFIGKYDQSFIDGYAERVERDRAKAVSAAKVAAAAKGVGTQARLAGIALQFYAGRIHYVYRQFRPMPADLFDPSAYNRLDCSSSVTLIYKAAGLPDPNGRGYDGQGYTGTLWPRGTYVNGTIQPGDLCFYGSQDGGIPSHVSIAISSTECISFGHTPIVRASIRYRGDFRGARRYI